MFKTLKNAWSIPELRKKLIFTAMILLIFCVGGKIAKIGYLLQVTEVE